MASKSRRAPQDQERIPPTPAPAGNSSDPETAGSLDDRLDEALGESFPASDPPAVHRLSRGYSFLP
jgi:hypothetical protein